MSPRASCWSCGRKFRPLTASDVTCSQSCEAELGRKRSLNERTRLLHNLRFGPPARRLARLTNEHEHRIAGALAETRAAVERLRALGRDARRSA